MAEVEPITHPLLERRGVEHGFGVKRWDGPAGLVRPKQVHGVAVAMVGASGTAAPAEADAILSRAGGPPVGVVTADCVPILLASRDGRRVAAIHAGWRGLAAGVIQASMHAWTARFGSESGLVAAIGPHARRCCYEVDAPVRAAFFEFEAEVLERAFQPRRAEHWMLDLTCLTRHVLEGSGLAASDIGDLDDACTVCGSDRFESYRRDGAAAGRLVHAITPRH